MSDESGLSLEATMSGAVIRAAICKRRGCGVVLGVAVDEVDSMKGIRVIHPRGSKGSPFSHRVVLKGESVMFWFRAEHGMQSCGIESGMVMRISKTPPPPAVDPLLYP